MQSKAKNNLILVRLFPEEDFYQELEKISKKYHIKTAIILSGLGQLKNFELGYFKKKGDYTPQKFIKPHELLALTGNISKQKNQYKFHIHANLGDENKNVIGGHLIKAQVDVTNEIILMKTNLRIIRKLEPETGLEGMFLE